jgi:hypothetical protein
MNEEKRAVYVSVGDRHWKVGLPFDSKATIEAVFDALAERFNVNRVFWRVSGEFWLRYYKRFEEDCLLYWQGYNRHSRTLCDEVGVTAIARGAARRHGMELWAHTGLYDLGSRERAGVVDPIVLEYPEAAPVNRYGTRRQEGSVELCHTEARRILVKRYTEFVVENGFDGLDFYLYLENLSLRYMDEFGYNRPIVEEYKRRYGVDILHEDFDRDAWAQIRGEYLTLFLRELREALGRHGRELSVELDPKHPDLPHTHGNDENPHPTTGRIQVDWRTWAREGVVDELVILRKGSTVEQAAALQRQLLETIGGAGCRITLSVPENNVALESGVTRMLSAWGPELESGFSYADHVGWEGKKFPDEFVADAPEVMAGADRHARRRFLYYVANGAAQASVDQIAEALRDEDVFVRRRAVDALGAGGSPEAVSHIEASLCDPEHSVRCRAGVVLAELHGPESADRLLEAVSRLEASPHFIEHCAAPSLAKIGAHDADSLVERLLDANLSVRRTVLFSLKILSDDVLLGAASRLSLVIGKDPDPYNRVLALEAASRVGTGDGMRPAILHALDDEAAPVRVAAAEALATLQGAGHLKNTDAAREAERMGELFRGYSRAVSRGELHPDRDETGWRRLGNALLGLGEKGEEVLRSMYDQRKDFALAELAWRVLYMPLRTEPGPFTMTEEDDRRAHERRPVLDLGLGD